MSTDIPMFEVLLERMRTHPEEFADGLESTKWGGIIERYSDCLTDEERKKLADGVHSARRQMLNEAIMKRLAGEDDDMLVFKSDNRVLFTGNNQTPAGNVTLASKHIQLHKALLKKIDEEREMDAMHEYYKKLGQAE